MLLKRFYMGKQNSLSTPIRCPDVESHLLGPEVPYMSSISGFLYLAKFARPDISFATNFLARYSSDSTHRH